MNKNEKAQVIEKPEKFLLFLHILQVGSRIDSTLR